MRPAQCPGAPAPLAANDLIEINSSRSIHAPPLPLHCPCCQTSHNPALEEEDEHNQGNTGDNASCHDLAKRHLLRKLGGEIGNDHRQRACVRFNRCKGQGKEIFIPGANEGEQTGCCEGRRRQGQQDQIKRLEGIVKLLWMILSPGNSKHFPDAITTGPTFTQPAPYPLFRPTSRNGFSSLGGMRVLRVDAA